MDARYRLAEVAALLADPARAGMVLSLMDGRSRPASELARIAGVSAATASAHLARLLRGGVLVAEPRGRHRFHRLANERIARWVESLASTLEPKRPKDEPPPPLHRARLCYDHLAGALGVAVSDALLHRSLLTHASGAYTLTPQGRRWFMRQGIEVAALARGRRPLLRSCLDWTERREHLGGALGAALANEWLERDWLRRERASRIVLVTTAGRTGLRAALGLSWD